MMPFPRLRRFLRDPFGTAALEFALIALPLILFTFGIIEIGRALFMQQQLFHATDMAARLLYIAPNTSTSALEAAILDDIFLGDLDRLEVAIGSPASVPGALHLGEVTLRVTYDFHSVVPDLVIDRIRMSFERTITIAR